MFAVSTSDASGEAGLLGALCCRGQPGGSWRGLSFLKVVKMYPPATSSMLVDSARTAVTLEVGAALDFDHRAKIKTENTA